MSAYREYIEEKERMDGYVSRQFRIRSITENLSGATLELEHPGGEKATLQVFSADARKYMSNLIITKSWLPIK